MPYIPYIHVIQFGKNKAILSGTILKNRPLFVTSNSKWHTSFLNIFSSYFHSPYSLRNINVEINGITQEFKTNTAGSFHKVLNSNLNSELDISVFADGKPVGNLQDYPIFFPDSSCPFAIISDIDDTIIRSYTADSLKRISTILFKTARKRKAVVATKDLLNTINKLNPQVFYVSKSERNLSHLIANIIKFSNLPQGPLLLTPWLNWRQLFNSKKGKNFKLEIIRTIINLTEGKKFILFGDDSQKDMDVYTQVINEYPDRILKVFIRQTKIKRSPAQLKKWTHLKSTGIDASYFKINDKLTIADEILKLTTL